MQTESTQQTQESAPEASKPKLVETRGNVEIWEYPGGKRIPRPKKKTKPAAAPAKEADDDQEDASQSSSSFNWGVALAGLAGGALIGAAAWLVIRKKSTHTLH